MSEPTAGQRIHGRFTLRRPLGRGGMSEVWLAHDGELGEDVVLKLVPPDASEAQVELLRRECREARKLVHPAIARVYDLHRADPHRFVTMAFIVLGRVIG